MVSSPVGGRSFESRAVAAGPSLVTVTSGSMRGTWILAQVHDGAMAAQSTRCQSPPVLETSSPVILAEPCAIVPGGIVVVSSTATSSSGASKAGAAAS